MNTKFVGANFADAGHVWYGAAVPKIHYCKTGY